MAIKRVTEAMLKQAYIGSDRVGFKKEYLMNYLQFQIMRKRAAELPNLAGQGTSNWDNDPDSCDYNAAPTPPGAGYFLDRYRFFGDPAKEQDPKTRIASPGIGNITPFDISSALLPTRTNMSLAAAAKDAVTNLGYGFRDDFRNMGRNARMIADFYNTNVIQPALDRHTNTKGTYPRLNAAVAASGGSTVPGAAQPLGRIMDAASRVSDRIGNAGLNFFGIKPHVNPDDLSVPTKNRPLPAGVGWRGRQDSAPAAPVTNMTGTIGSALISKK